MPAKIPLAAELRELYAKEFARLQQDFYASSDGRAAVGGRTALVEFIAGRLWNESISLQPGGPPDFALVALGGFGRATLYPYSDVDLLFLHAGDSADEKL